MLIRDQAKFGFWRRVRRELTYAFFIGSLPLLACTTAAEVTSLVNALLAAPQLMEYYVYLLSAFVIVSLSIWRTTFRKYLFIGKSRELHKFFVNIGASLLTAFRTALGAMIGFLLVWYLRDLDGMSADGTVAVMGYALFTLMVCVLLAWTDEILRNPHGASRYS